MGAHAAKVTSKGQITLPVAVREAFGIRPGDQIVFFKNLNDQPTFTVRRMSREPIRPILQWTGPPRTDAELDEGIGRAVVEDFLRADRDSRSETEEAG
jgi:AbrB family looped-hinge helix DNA binding protein